LGAGWKEATQKKPEGGMFDKALAPANCEGTRERENQKRANTDQRRKLFKKGKTREKRAGKKGQKTAETIKKRNHKEKKPNLQVAE